MHDESDPMNYSDERARNLVPRVDGDNAPPTPVVASTRRRFIKGGLSVAPVLLTLHSRPVLAWQCQSPSAFCSGNASHPQTVADEGCKTISYWQTCSSYPSTCGFTKATLFKNVYSCSDTTLGSKTVDTVLRTGSTFQKYMLAARLNIVSSSGAAQCLSKADLNEMWTGCYNATGYCPSPGITWTATDIQNYLKTNWIVPG
jgi:hypothetical protein